MTLSLVDENVLREMAAGGNARVRAWFATVNDDQLRVSAITFLEKREGWARRRRKLAAQGKDTAPADHALAALTAFEDAFADRQVPVDMHVSREAATMLGAKSKNQRDTLLAATARVHNLVVVTRNLKDFEGRGVRVLNPFEKDPKVRTA
jgi:hypothetical protein